MSHEIREAIYEGAGIELYPDVNAGTGYYARVGTLDTRIGGKTAAHVFLLLADIMLGGDGDGGLL